MLLLRRVHAAGDDGGPSDTADMGGAVQHLHPTVAERRAGWLIPGNHQMIVVTANRRDQEIV
jgi:hypothetical protein